MHAPTAFTALRWYRSSMLTLLGLLAAFGGIIFFDPRRSGLAYAALNSLLVLGGLVALTMFVALFRLVNAAPGLGRYVLAGGGLAVASAGVRFAAVTSSRWSPDESLLLLSAALSVASVFVFNLVWLRAAEQLSLWHLQPRLWGALLLSVFAMLVLTAPRLGVPSGVGLVLVGFGASVSGAVLLWHTLGQLQRSLESVARSMDLE